MRCYIQWINHVCWKKLRVHIMVFIYIFFSLAFSCYLLLIRNSIMQYERKVQCLLFVKFRHGRLAKPHYESEPLKKVTQYDKIFHFKRQRWDWETAGPLVQTDFNPYFRDIKYLKTMELHHNFWSSHRTTSL